MKKKIIIGLIITLVGLLTITIILPIFSNKKESVQVNQSTQSARLITLTKQTLYDSVTVKGLVESNQATTVSTALATKVVDLRVKLGDYVEKGQIICLLDDTEIQNQITELKQSIKDQKETSQTLYDKTAASKKDLEKQLETEKKARSEAAASLDSLKVQVDNAKSALDNYQSTYDTAKNNYDVAQQVIQQQQDLLNQAIAQRQIALDNYQNYLANKDDPSYDVNEELRLKSLADQAEAALNTASLNYDQALKTNEYLTATTVYYTVNEQYQNLQSTYQALKNNYDNVLDVYDTKIKTLTEQISTLNDTLTSTKKTIDQLNNSVQLKNLEKQLEATILKSESAGRITQLNVNVGSMPQGIVAIVQSISDLKVSSVVKDTEISSLQEGMKVVITSDAKQQTIEGKLSMISLTANAETQTFNIEISLPETEDLYIGTKVNAKIIIQQKDNVLVVDKQAILEQEDGSYVKVLQDDGSFKAIKVKIVAENQTEAAIESNELQENDKILAVFNWEEFESTVNTETETF